MERLDRDECIKLMEGHPAGVGRVALAGPRPVIFPVNFAIDRGNVILSACRRALAPKGTYIPNNGAGGRWVGPLGRIAKARFLSLFSRQKLRPFLSLENRDDLLALAELIAAGKLTPVIDRTYPLSQAAEALRYVGEGHTQGKVVVTV